MASSAERDAHLAVLPFDDAVAYERDHQREKHGDKALTAAEWVTVLGSEVGEVFHELKELAFAAPTIPRLRAARSELVQVAAVCAAMIEQIDAALDRLSGVAALRTSYHIRIRDQRAYCYVERADLAQALLAIGLDLDSEAGADGWWFRLQRHGEPVGPTAVIGLVEDVIRDLCRRDQP